MFARDVDDAEGEGIRLARRQPGAAGRARLPAGPRRLVSGHGRDGLALVEHARSRSACSPRAPGQTVYVASGAENRTYRATVQPDGTLGGPGAVRRARRRERGGGQRRATSTSPTGRSSSTTAAGKALGRIDVPERPIQILFGGADRRTLFVLTHHTLYATRTVAPGLNVWRRAYRRPSCQEHPRGQKLPRPLRSRNPRPCHFARGGRRAHLRRLRRRPARELSRLGAVFDEMQKEEDGHRARLLDMYRAKFGEHIPLIRREDVKGFVQRRRCGCPTAWVEGRAAAGGDHGARDAPLLRARHRQDRRRVDPQAARRPGCHRARALRARRRAREAVPHRRRQAIRRRRRAAALRPADRPARPRRTDGRLGLDARAALRGGVRHAQLARRVRRRPGRLGWRGHLDGLRGGPVG